MKLLYFTKAQTIILFSLLILSLLLFLLLNPSASRLFGFSSAHDEIITFIDQSISEERIDPQEFWRAREFAAPGSFIYDREVLVKDATDEAFLRYESDIWTSNEFLIPEDQTIILSPEKEDCSQIFLQTDHELICQTSSGSFTIMFVKPIDEMLQANAFLDVKGRDKELVEGKQWFVESKIY